MYAVFEAGGKQHRVEVDEVIRVEKIEAEVGSSVDFDKVLMVADGDSIEIGAPWLQVEWLKPKSSVRFVATKLRSSSLSAVSTI